MPIPLSIRLQEGKARSLQTTYEQWKNDHAQAMAARDLEDLVKECLTLVSNMEPIWNRLWADLNTGMKFDPDGLGQLVDGLFTRVIRLSQDVKAYATRFTQETGHAIAGLGNLERDTLALETLHQRIMANWPWRDRAWPPLDKAMQQRSRSHADGPGDDVEDLLRRLEADQPLI